VSRRNEKGVVSNCVDRLARRTGGEPVRPGAVFIRSARPFCGSGRTMV